MSRISKFTFKTFLLLNKFYRTEYYRVIVSNESLKYLLAEKLIEAHYVKTKNIPSFFNDEVIPISILDNDFNYHITEKGVQAYKEKRFELFFKSIKTISVLILIPIVVGIILLVLENKLYP